MKVIDKDAEYLLIGKIDKVIVERWKKEVIININDCMFVFLFK